MAARALVEDGHADRACTPTGPAALTYGECATILTEVLGRPIRYADPTPWHDWRRMRRRGMPPAMIAVTIGNYTAARFGLALGDAGAETTAQLVWILAARLPGPDGEAILSRSIDSMGAEREDGTLWLTPRRRGWRR